MSGRTEQDGQRREGQDRNGRGGQRRKKLGDEEVIGNLESSGKCEIARCLVLLLFVSPQMAGASVL